MIITKYLYSTGILKVQKRFTTAVVIVNTKYRIAVNLKKREVLNLSLETQVAWTPFKKKQKKKTSIKA